MAGYGRARPPLWFWIVAGLIVLWGVAGIFAFYADATMSASALAAMPDYDRALYQSRPAWFVWVYGLATWGGLIGGLLLLARLRLAAAAFAVSLVAVVVQFGWVFAATDLIAAKGAGATVPFPLFIAAVAAFQLWFAGWAGRKGWLR